MGVDLSSLLERSERELSQFKGRAVAVDAYNALYQFLSIIRQPDGTPLVDRMGRTTSHLSGLLYRSANLMEAGIRPVYVFDGKPDELKKNTIAQRKAAKEKAQEEYTKALSKYMDNGYNIALDPSSKTVDSHEFASLFKDRGVVNIFIGGAYGFERAFLDKSNICVSFGKITLSHKLVKIVALEQVFRGLSILNSHPYHK